MKFEPLTNLCNRLGMRRTKISTLREHMAAGRWTEALALASKFLRLGDGKVDVERAHQAIQSPSFTRQVGSDPDQLIQQGRHALERRGGRRPEVATV